MRIRAEANVVFQDLPHCMHMPNAPAIATHICNNNASSFKAVKCLLKGCIDGLHQPLCATGWRGGSAVTTRLNHNHRSNDFTRDFKLSLAASTID